MNGRRSAIAVSTALAAFCGIAVAAGCSTPTRTVSIAPAAPAAVSYAPAAYGENGHCYYIDDPAEAASLIQSGLCPAAWTPAPMPLTWHEEYYDYYASPAYYNTYVPVRYRTVWVSQSSTFYTQNKTTIVVVQKNATYKDSTGKTVPAAQMPSAKLSFGPGVKPGPTFGSVAPPKVSADNAPAQPKLSFGNGAKPSAPKPVPVPVVPR